MVVLARAYRAGLLTLLAVALVPSLWHWSGYVVRSDSMRPAIDAGDVVVARPFDPDERRSVVGRVMLVADPSAGGRLVAHRVVRRDGPVYVTAGDANADPDVHLVERSELRARAVLLVPLVGRPVRWAREGDLAPLVVWLLVTAAALRLAPGPRPVGGRRTAGRAAVAAVTVGAVVVGQRRGAQRRHGPDALRRPGPVGAAHLHRRDVLPDHDERGREALRLREQP